MDFQAQKPAPPKANQQKVARNPNNANILKGGKVDPRSELYQRSVAGREQLKDYLSRLSNSGADEADVFMAGVKSLMNRGHGYVGAYLDSKNPGRRYEKNQAMAITDKVMTDEGIGENPGARLTRPKVTDEEGKVDKEATKEARDKRKEDNAGRGSGPQQAPGPSAKPVGQQRKEGKRESTGEALEDSRREGIDDRDRYYQPVSKGADQGSVDVERKWQQEMTAGFEKIKTDLGSGKITPDEAKAQISELNSRSKEFVKGGKQEREQGLKDDAAIYKRREDRKKQRDGGAQDQPPGGDSEAPEDTAEKEAFLTGDQANELNKEFKASFQRYYKSQGNKITSENIDEIVEDLSGYLDLDPKLVSDYISGTFPEEMGKIGWSAKTTSAPGDKQQEAAPPTAAPETKPPQPGQQETTGPESASTPKEKIYRPAAKGQFEGQVASDIDTKELTVDDSMNHMSYRAAMRALRSGRGMFGRDIEGYEWGVSRGLPSTPDEEDKIIASRNEAAAPQGGGQEAQAPATREPLPEERLGRGRKRSGGKAAPGFTTEIGKQAIDTLRQAVSEGNSPQEVVKQFRRGNLFGKTGFETGSASTNPLEGGSTPAPTSTPEELAPSSGLPGEGRPTSETAKAGQPGQQGMFKSGTTSPRTASGFGKPAGPSNPVETPEDRVNRMKELTGGGMSSDAALKQMTREGSVTPRTTGGRGRVKTAPDQGGAKNTPIMDDVVRGAGNISRNIGNAFNKARERHNNSPGGKFFQVSEQDRGTQMSYDEFSQSVRSMMR